MVLIGGRIQTASGPVLVRCNWLRPLSPLTPHYQSSAGDLVRGHAHLSDLNVEVRQACS
jgi:hypothetical protein